EMNMRKAVLETFRKSGEGKVVWQPRIDYWYYGNRLRNKVPEGYRDESILEFFYHNIDAYEEGQVSEQYRDMTMLEVYDDLGASPRYPQETLGVEILKETRLPNSKANDQVSVESHYDSRTEEITTIYHTPRGNLKKVTSGYVKEYPIKKLEDIEIMKYVIRNTGFEFDSAAFKIADETFGERGPVQTFSVRSPFQSLIIEHMGFKNTFLTLRKYPQKVGELLEVMDQMHDRLWDMLLDSPIEIFNFGENIDQHFDPPPVFEEYLLPYYEKRIKAIHKRGKFCHIHVDGSFKQLVPVLRETNFDGLEALTPLPQGDVDLEYMKEALGNKVLLDGIPAILFIPDYSYDYLQNFTDKILKTFAPNLILGISDELPPDGDIEKVKFVSDLVNRFNSRQG
ncbi:MAG: uroporphyrinogen decarboxylase family protein, partial [Candidatus Heimdallarchaeota archaeon]